MSEELDICLDELRNLAGKDSIRVKYSGRNIPECKNMVKITYTDCKKISKHHRFFIQVFEALNYFVIWDWHFRETYKCEINNLSLSSFKPQDFDFNTYEAYYQKMRTSDMKSSKHYEKVMVVGSNYYQHFVEHFPDIMKLNDKDCSWPSQLEFDIYDCNALSLRSSAREKYSTVQAKRDYSFANIVKSSYGHKCAICGCDIAEVLQAAHEKGYEVKNTSFDDPNHGICLCANHHLMYDRELLEIDLKNRKYRFSPVTKQTKWLKLFCEDFKGDIEYAPTSCN